MRDSALKGKYACSYCKQQHAEWGRFQIYAPDNETQSRIVPLKNLSFCTPECAAAYNLYMSVDNLADDARRNRHVLLERICERGIVAAPPPIAMQEWPSNAWRLQWLHNCRRGLSVEEQDIIDKEMFVRENKFSQ